MPKRRRNLRPELDQLDARCLLSAVGPGSPSGLTPAQITALYGLNSITFNASSGVSVKGDGSGETIALIELNSDPYLQSELNTFDAEFGLPAPKLTVVNLAGSQTDSGWSTEQALDLEWTHAIAPDANILVVQADPSGSSAQELQNLMNAVNAARNTQGVVAVSMSWGFNETSSESQYDAYFTTPAGHPGVAFIAASGDNGTVEYPATSPNVLGIGGTTLNLSNSGGYGSENAWYATGGGYSQYEGEPGYQSSVQQTKTRSAPDVAFDGDPNTGVAVYSIDATSGQGTWEEVGGTSLGAPAWAGIVAIVDQGRAVSGEGSLDGPTQLLPALYAAPSTDFHTVTGTSVSSIFGGGLTLGGFDPFGSGIFIPGPVSTTPGATANTSTGLGTPIGQALISDLVASTLTRPLTFVDGASTQPVAKPTKRDKKHRKHHNTNAHTTHKAKTHSVTRPESAIVAPGENKGARNGFA